MATEQEDTCTDRSSSEIVRKKAGIESGLAGWGAFHLRESRGGTAHSSRGFGRDRGAGLRMLSVNWLKPSGPIQVK